MFKKNQQGVSYWAIIIVVAFMVIALIIAVWPQDMSNTGDDLSPTRIRLLHKLENQVGQISERAKIEKWIVDYKLNEYGENPYTIYAGGTPLFDEATGKILTRYEYIIKRHPNKPWDK